MSDDNSDDDTEISPDFDAADDSLSRLSTGPEREVTGDDEYLVTMAVEVSHPAVETTDEAANYVRDGIEADFDATMIHAVESE